MSDLKLYVDKTVVHHVFNQGFGGIENFADVWNGTLEDDEPTAQPQRSVKTIYAWLQNGLPTARDTMMRFFGALGVDPVAAIDLDGGNLQRQFGRLRRAFLLGGANAGGFRPLFELYSPSAGWPEQGLAASYFGRKWTTFEFVHQARETRNTYATVHVYGGDDVPPDWPRAFHIAYRRMSNADGLWRPYGSVITRPDEAILVHENGNVQREPFTARTNHHVSFKTFFGPGPAEFRLACLQPFTCRVEVFDDPEVMLHFAG